MPELPYMTEEAKRWIGHETVEVSDPVSLRHIKEYVAGTDDWNPLYFDEEYARKGPYGGIIAPPLFHDAPTRPVVPESQLLPDGQYNNLAVPGIYGRSVAAGSDVELFAPVRVGDVITKRTRVVDIREKQGRSGLLIIQTSQTTHTNQRGELIARETRTLIFR